MRIKTEEQIIQTLRQNYKILIGERTAEELRESLQDWKTDFIMVKGRALESGLKASIEAPVEDFFERMK